LPFHHGGRFNKEERTVKKTLLALALGLPAVAFAQTQSRVIDAPVVAVEPLVEIVTERVPFETCRQERVRVVERDGPRSATPAILGAVLGGTLAGAAGDDTGYQGVIAGAGAALGASVGNDIGRRYQQRDGGYYVTEDVCTTEYEVRERERTGGYRVSYRYGDTIYETRTNRDPGATIPIRVQLTPLP
jgi:uncharacterized protein YcfJ